MTDARYPAVKGDCGLHAIDVQAATEPQEGRLGSSGSVRPSAPESAPSGPENRPQTVSDRGHSDPQRNLGARLAYLADRWTDNADGRGRSCEAIREMRGLLDGMECSWLIQLEARESAMTGAGMSDRCIPFGDGRGSPAHPTRTARARVGAGLRQGPRPYGAP